MPNPDSLPRFCGQPVSNSQLSLIQQLTTSYPHLSRTELAATACELLEWLRPNGKPKTVECRSYLETLEQQQRLSLPPQRSKRTKQVAVAIATDSVAKPTPIRLQLKALAPLQLQPVVTAEQRHQWRSLVEQHHYLGHRIPFGAHLRYLIESVHGVVGCLQYSSPAWRLQARDRWIGWTDTQRQAGLQHILCNSRFLILPWVEVPNLASHILAKSARQVGNDWQAHYGVRPWLLETLVDSARFSGACYRAANWIPAGQTSGRGRNDRHHGRHGAAPKSLWLYPLHKHCQRLLRGEE